MPSASRSLSAADPALPPPFSLRLTHDRAINYAFQQNALPVIQDLLLRNEGAPQRSLVLRITTEPAFAAPLDLALPALEPGGEFRAGPLELTLLPDVLGSLTETVSGWLRLSVLEEGVELYTQREPVSLLAVNTWCGLASLPEILAAFVLPNDPAVTSLLGRAAELLRAATGQTVLNGYQDRNRQRAWEQVAAIYRALGELGIHYLNPAPGFASDGQRVSSPTRLVADRLGNCLDLALLCAACCERAGLHPWVLLHEGHAYAGCWLEDRSLAEPCTDDLQHVRKLESESLITVFEATALTHADPGTLRDAERAARGHLQTTLPFRLGLDVHRARSARIRPLPLPGQSSTPEPDGVPTPEQVSDIGTRTFIAPDTPASPPAAAAPAAPRLDQWKSRLLDLSRRNRLLNFKETKTTVRLLATDLEHVEDPLAAARELSLLPRPRLMGGDDPRDASTLARQQRVDALAEHLRDELAQGRLHTALDETEHARRLTELFRAARNALEENGSNTLFVAIGILEWRETEHADRVFRAPLLLLPVELRRRSVLDGFSLRRIDEDTRLNVTLVEMLRQQFHKEIPGLDPLPEDDAGVKVAVVLQRVRDAVRDLAGWEVKEELWLGQFSFTKFLLWKDLADRLEDLTRNRIVRHLVHEAGVPYPNPPEDIRAAQLDDHYHPRDVFCPRSADSSQLAAVMAAAAGHDFVLEGPPGTGKSQTITNIIAHCLAHGKRVLFVAEKRAALDVVHRRLREEGLEPFCLQLHSNKTGKADVLAQFELSLKEVASAPPADWARRAEELAQLRAALNHPPRALHRCHPSGLSAYDCLDYLLPRQDEPTVRLTETAALLETPAEALEHLRRVVRLAQERSRPLLPLAGHALAWLGCQEWSPAWAERSLERLRQLGARVPAAAAAALDLHIWLGRKAGPSSRADLVHLAALAELLPTKVVAGPGLVTQPWSTVAPQLDRWCALGQERAGLREQLAGYDEPRLLALDLDGLQARHDSAREAWAPVRWWRLRGVCQQLGLSRTDSRAPAAESLVQVLPAARRLRQINAVFAADAAVGPSILGPAWNQGEPDPTALVSVRQWSERLQLGLVAVAGDDLAWLAHLRSLLGALLAEGPAASGPDTAIGRRWTGFREAWTAFDHTLSDVTADLQLRRAALDAEVDHLPAVAELVTRVSAAWPKIREWCSWQKIRHEACALGAGPVIERREEAGGEALDLPALFERSFRRALLFASLEDEPVLREFFGREHEERIERFRELDERMAVLTRAVIRSRLAAAVPGEGSPDTGPKAEIGLLRKEIGKRMRHLPVRQLLARIPHLLPRLKPCVLMSPLSVAQYLEINHELFDVVIFDEASQIPVWDAVGAIARGRQLIVVGDPKQLPPTQFFTTQGETEEDDRGPEEYQDLESILDELLSHQLRHKRLQWHYRSRHEGLIAFSNRQYYENDLLTFPSAATGGGGVRFHHLPDARYDKGNTRTNRLEAQALVQTLIGRLTQAEGPRRSFGVVTFSQAQQELVENLLDEERRRRPEIEVHFGDDPPVEGEPVFVKNLENVQGDERDVILFSIGYGPDEHGKVSMNFGPLNRDGGERRLNVAITRAKHEVLVFSGLRGDQIDLSRTRARGVRDLKHFLDYAERGPSALAVPGGTVLSGSAPESEFERLVTDRLRAAGYEVQTQVGCSGYRIDLAVVDPATPGRYLLGVEWDGPTYHRAATARDRDKLRQLVLEGLGWKLHRIWVTDWWHQPEEECRRLLDHLTQLQTPVSSTSHPSGRSSSKQTPS